MRIPEWLVPLCRFCKSPAVGVFELSAGCFCFPADREQSLCMQHVVRATPLGDITLMIDLTVEGF